MIETFNKLDSENYQSKNDNKTIEEIYNVLGLTDREIILSLLVHCQALKCEIMSAGYVSNLKSNELIFREGASFRSDDMGDDREIAIYILKLFTKVGLEIQFDKKESYDFDGWEGALYFNINVQDNIRYSPIAFCYSYGCGINNYNFELSSASNDKLDINDVDSLNNIIDICYSYLNEAFSLKCD